MAIITKHELDATEQGQVIRMICEAVSSGQRMPWDGHNEEDVWKPGLADFVPMLTTTGYYPQDCRNGFDDHPVRTVDCPEFARQAALALDMFSSCLKDRGAPFHISTSSRLIAENITCNSGRSMCVGAIVLAALASGYTLTTASNLGDGLFVTDISLGSLLHALELLKREVADA